MGTDLTVVGRAQLAGAGLAGTIRGRVRPFAVIAAVDVLAVALAFGAIHLTGMMVGGGGLPSLVPPVAAATEPVAAVTPLIPPAPRLAPARRELATMPEADVMFAAPGALAEIGRGFTFDAPASSTSGFAPPTATAMAEPQPAPAAAPIPTPRLRPAERLASIAAPVIDANDGSLDRLLLRDAIPAIGTTLAQTGSAVKPLVGTTLGATATVAAPVQSVAQAVTQPVTQVVQGVVSLLR